MAKRKFQNGGKQKGEQKKAPAKKPTTQQKPVKAPQKGSPELAEQREFYLEYLNSPNYRKRLLKQGNKNIDEIIKARLANAKGIQYVESDYLGSQYFPQSNTVWSDTVQNKQINIPKRTLKAHEFSHGVGSLHPDMDSQPNKLLKLNRTEDSVIRSKNKLFKLDISKMPIDKVLEVAHDRSSAEVKADIDTLRFHLKKDKIYDTGTQDFDKETLRKAKKKYKGITFDRLFKNFSDEDLIYLMNNIAATNQSSDSNIAKAGTKMAKRKFNNGGKSGLKKPKPYMQSNTFATSSREDSIMQDMADYEELPHNKQVYLDELGKNKEASFDKGAIRDFILGALGAIPELLPQGRDNFTIEPMETYNPFPQGTGSQAIAKAGASISPKKARKILRDGTAHGKQLTDMKKKYFGWIAGGGKAQHGLEVSGGGEGESAQERYYKSSAVLAHYKGILNEKLKAKNPKAYSDYFKGLVDLRRSGKQQDALKYVQESPYEEYLTPDEVRSTLGEEDYQMYLNSLKNVNEYNVLQGMQPLYGTKETGGSDPATLNYGRRFASLVVTPTTSVSNKEGTKKYSRVYKYDPSKRSVSFTEEGDFSLRPSYLSEPQNTDVSKMKAGGTIEFKGPSHKNGGIPISFAGKEVEVEGGETAFVDSEGDLNIMGNMFIPGTKTKFKKASKAIMKEEQRLEGIVKKIADSGDFPINDKFGRLKQNTNALMAKGVDMGMRDLSAKKERLAAIQNEMLSMAMEAGIDPIAMSEGKMKKAKAGYKMKAAAGTKQNGGGGDKDSVAKRHNNPGNIKYASWMKKYGAVKGEKATDGGYFAKFPDVKTGLTALKDLLKSKNYKNLDVESAINRWTGGTPYKINLGELSGKKISSLNDAQFNKLVDVITMGEDSKLYRDGDVAKGSKTKTSDIPIEKVKAPEWVNAPIDSPAPTRNNRNKIKYTDPGYPETELGTLSYEDKKLPSATEFNRITFSDIAPEVFAVVSSKVEPVPAQTYNPDFFSPYQVSFQDRLNRNQSTFNAVRRAMASNPAAIGLAAAQQYAADSEVLADEFRTNQGIANDIINKNVALSNDAQLKNLAIKDEQMVRQATARSKTRSQLFEAMKSVQMKYALNDLENARIKTYEPLFDYRYTDQNNDGTIDDFEYLGEDPRFDYGPAAGVNASEKFTRTRETYGPPGNLRQVQKMTPSPVSQAKEELQLQELMQKVSDDFMTRFPFNRNRR